jgi:diguanylate cyclase (GGDEF)-like protein
MTGRRALSVLVIDDQKTVRAALEKMLTKAGHEIVMAVNAEDGIKAFREHRPDVVLLDVEMAGIDGYETARRLRMAEPGGWTPIIFLSGHGSDEDLWRGIEAGGDDYLIKPVSPLVLGAKLRAMQRLVAMRQKLVAMSQDLQVANEKLQRLAEIDELTGLHNRRGLETRLHQEVAAARREKSPLTVLLVDVDHFKIYNDMLGHIHGDVCLREVAIALRDSCHRPRDCAARYGGEEFALILPNTPKSGAMMFARVLQSLLERRELTHPGSPVHRNVTLSGGITTCVPDDNTTAADMLLRADEALYAAKELGRNRFFSYEMQIDTDTHRQTFGTDHPNARDYSATTHDKL